MTGRSWMTCSEPGNPVIRAMLSERLATSGDEVYHSVLQSGWCPACPEHQLAEESVEILGASTGFRCPCCRALWLLDSSGPGTWGVLDRGRLVEGPTPKQPVTVADLLTVADVAARFPGQHRDAAGKLRRRLSRDGVARTGRRSSGESEYPAEEALRSALRPAVSPGPKRRSVDG